MIAAVIQGHVDDTSDDFSILSTANDFKDYVKSFFVGTVAAGISYLAMIEAGYHWSDHFEHVTGSGVKGRTPDFVFASLHSGIALTESKGTRSSGKNGFDSLVEAGYLEQVEPHLGNEGGIGASHGYCVGSWLTSANKAEILVHQTATTSVDDGAPNDGSVVAVMRQNYATAFSLAFGVEYGSQLRRASFQSLSLPPLIQFEWLGRRWLTRWPFVSGYRYPDRPYDEWRDWRGEFPFRRRAIFALDIATTKAVLSRFSGEQIAIRRPSDLGVEPIPRDVIAAAKSDDGAYGAVFPDGLAVIGPNLRLKDRQRLYWDATEGRFVGSEG